MVQSKHCVPTFCSESIMAQFIRRYNDSQDKPIKLTHTDYILEIIATHKYRRFKMLHVVRSNLAQWCILVSWRCSVY